MSTSRALHNSNNNNKLRVLLGEIPLLMLMKECWFEKEREIEEERMHL